MTELPHHPREYRHFFIVGSRRAGTTLLRLILNAHPQVHCPDEGDCITETWQKFHRLPESAADAAEARKFLRAHFSARESRFPLLASGGLRELLLDYTGKKLSDSEKELRGLQIHDDFYHLADLFPAAKFIFIRRDPHDIAESMCKLGWSGNAWVASEEWWRSEIFHDKLKQTLGRDYAERCLEVRFEKLVNSPQEVTAKIFSHLRVDQDPGVLDRFYLGTTYGPIDSKESFKWMRKNQGARWDLVSLRYGDELLALGYPGYSRKIRTLWLRSVLQHLLKFDHRVRRFAFNLRLYGPRIMFGKLFLRIFDQPHLRERIATDEYRIWRKTLK